jgi:hypothetical protein
VAYVSSTYCEPRGSPCWEHAAAARAPRARPRRGSSAAAGCRRWRCRASPASRRGRVRRRRELPRRRRTRCPSAVASDRRGAARGPLRSRPARQLQRHSRRPPAGLCTRSVPSSASARCLSPTRPGAEGSAPPSPSSTTSAKSTPSLDSIRARRRTRLPRSVGPGRAGGPADHGAGDGESAGANADDEASASPAVTAIGSLVQAGEPETRALPPEPG